MTHPCVHQTGRTASYDRVCQIIDGEKGPLVVGHDQRETRKRPTGQPRDDAILTDAEDVGRPQQRQSVRGDHGSDDELLCPFGERIDPSAAGIRLGQLPAQARRAPGRAGFLRQCDCFETPSGDQLIAEGKRWRCVLRQRGRSRPVDLDRGHQRHAAAVQGRQQPRGRDRVVQDELPRTVRSRVAVPGGQHDVPGWEDEIVGQDVDLHRRDAESRRRARRTSVDGHDLASVCQACLGDGRSRRTRNCRRRSAPLTRSPPRSSGDSAPTPS